MNGNTRVCFVIACALCISAGCGEDGSSIHPSVCDIGASRACACTDGSTGAQACRDAVLGWDECVCKPAQPVSTACDGVTCANGTCVPAADGAVCVCFDEYLSSRDAEGNPTCVKGAAPIVDKCDGIDCAGHGACATTPAGAAICVCESGYVSGTDAMTHVPTCTSGAPKNACSEVDCTTNGVCIEVDGGAVCRCNDGYSSSLDANGKPTCESGEPTSGPCVDVGCSGHGKCVVTADSAAYCLCDSGYSQSSKTECEVDANSPCAGVSCDGKGFCGIVNDAATCWCKDGYETDNSGSVPTCKESVVVDPCDGITCGGNGKCLSTSSGIACLCDSGYKASNDGGEPTCIVATEKSPCDGVGCSGLGMCMVAGDNTAFCMCNAGYHQNPLDAAVCEIDTNPDSPCKNVDCSGSGTCMVSGDDKALCLCNPGFHQKTGDATICEKDTDVVNPCKDVKCSSKGSCMVAGDDAAVCLCNTGYHQGSDPTTCEKDSEIINPCKGIDCDGNGICMVAGDDSAFCLCNAGFKQGDEPTSCVEDDLPDSPCKNVNCSGHGTCMISGDNSALCLCNTGYHQGTKPTVCDVDIVDSPCKGVTCSGKGTCMVSAGNAPICMCETGYHQGTVPTSCDPDDTTTPCTGVTCSDKGVCVVNNDKPYCLCNHDYHQGADGKTCVADEIVESPCKGQLCSNHGACVVTGDDKPYCLCSSGYHQGSTTTCVADDPVVNPCKDQKCSGHGVCVVTGSDSAYCICEGGYYNKSALVCEKNPASTDGPSHGLAFPTETVDPWGLVWDSAERPATSHSNAAAACAAMGGRLPSSNEIFRNNWTTGQKGVGDATNANYLWTSDHLWSQHAIVRRLSDGGYTNYVYTTLTIPYRCVWDPEPRPIILEGVNCNGLPSDKESCVRITMGTRGKVSYTMDARDRAPLPWHAAQQDCRRMGGRLPTSGELMTMVMHGLPNGTGAWLWGDTVYYNGYQAFLFKWTGTVDGSYAYSSNWSYTGWTTYEPYRCIYEDVQLVNKEPVFPQPKAKTAMEVTPLLRIDKEERSAANYWGASLDCREDGGRLASVDEMEAATRLGLKYKDNTWHYVRDSYTTNTWVVRSGLASGGVPGTYWDLNANYGSTGPTVAYPYFCTYRPSRDYEATKALLDKRVADGYSFGYTQDFSAKGGKEIYHFVRDLTDQSGGNIISNIDSCNADGMYLPFDDDLTFMIRHGLEGGTNNYLWTANATGWLYYRAIRWSGTGSVGYDPSANNSHIAWSSSTNPYRAYYSSVVY